MALKSKDANIPAALYKEFKDLDRAITQCKGINYRYKLKIPFIGVNTGTQDIELRIDKQCAKEVYKLLCDCYERQKIQYEKWIMDCYK
jgi:hypothetical protein